MEVIHSAAPATTTKKTKSNKRTIRNDESSRLEDYLDHLSTHGESSEDVFGEASYQRSSNNKHIKEAI